MNECACSLITRLYPRGVKRGKMEVKVNEEYHTIKPTPSNEIVGVYYTIDNTYS